MHCLLMCRRRHFGRKERHMRNFQSGMLWMRLPLSARDRCSLSQQANKGKRDDVKGAVYCILGRTCHIAG